MNFSLLEALAERFNHQTNTFVPPKGETTPTLEEVARISGLKLAEIVHQPSSTTDDHSIMGAPLLGAANSSRGQWERAGYTIVPTVLEGIYRGLHDWVTRGDRFIEGSVLILQVWAYEDIAIICPPRSTTAISVALGLAYVNDSNRPQNVNYFRRVLKELSSFDWVIRGLENVSLFLPGMGHSCVTLAGQFFTEEAIHCRPIFSLRQHSSALLIKESLSWKGTKSSFSEGLAKHGKLTTTSNYDSWWEHACPLPLFPRSSRLLGESSAPGQDLVLHREDEGSCSK
ncbi:hypothetical protein AMTRI_Chr02g259090 [Amborella trichopoda]